MYRYVRVRHVAYETSVARLPRCPATNVKIIEATRINLRVSCRLHHVMNRFGADTRAEISAGATMRTR